MAAAKVNTDPRSTDRLDDAVRYRLNNAITSLNVIRDILTDIIVSPQGPESRALIVRDSITLHGRSLEMVYTALSGDRIGSFEDEDIGAVLEEETEEVSNG